MVATEIGVEMRGEVAARAATTALVPVAGEDGGAELPLRRGVPSLGYGLRGPLPANGLPVTRSAPATQARSRPRLRREVINRERLAALRTVLLPVHDPLTMHSPTSV